MKPTLKDLDPRTRGELERLAKSYSLDPQDVLDVEWESSEKNLAVSYGVFHDYSKISLGKIDVYVCDGRWAVARPNLMHAREWICGQTGRKADSLRDLIAAGIPTYDRAIEAIAVARSLKASS